MSWLFVHVPKTGGASVRAALRQLGDAYGAAVYHRSHAGAREHVASMGRERWEALLTFSVVRDPFARLVSCWGFAFADEPRRVASRRQFRTWVAEGCSIPNRFYLHVGPGRGLWMHAPQVEWLTDAEGAIAVRQLYRLERLASEWPALLRRLGLGQVPLGNANSSRHEPVEFYYEAVTRERVRERYAEDFALLESLTRG